MPQRTGDMPPAGASRRDRDADAAERLRTVRERLEATVSGLGELDYLRQRQEALVRAALEVREEAEEQPPGGEEEEEEEERRRREEKLLEENILLLRKQLNCLRRRDAGLLTQLQELDKQISDLRLDTEVSHDPLEPDSRPSSGFYELSDAASGSLSNSSNSVFSECFCPLADADGRLPFTDELASCLECDGLVGGLCDDSALFGVRRSLSAPHPTTATDTAASSDLQLKYHCNLVARNGSEVYRYPSPLHAVAVQSPILLQMLVSHSKDEGLAKNGETAEKTESSPYPAPLVPQSFSWQSPNSSSSSQTPPHKRLDSYIYSLLQRRAQPIRTSKPRTSISTDPSKSILRQASLCVRQAPTGVGTLRGSDTKPSWVVVAEDAAALSPQRQSSVESKGEDQETLNGLLSGGGDGLQNGLTSDLAQNQNSSPQSKSIQNISSGANKDINPSTNGLLKKACKGRVVSTGTLPKDFRELARSQANSCPKETRQADQEALVKSPPSAKTQVGTPKNSPQQQREQAEKVHQAGLEFTGMGSSSQSQDEGGGDGQMVSAKYIPAKQQNIKIRKSGGKNVKTAKVKSWSSEHNEPERRGNKSQHRTGSKILLEKGGSNHTNVSKRAGGPGVSSRVKRLHASIPEGRVLDKHATSTLGSVRTSSSRQHHYGNHHHHHHQHHHNGNHHHHQHHHGHSHHHHHGRDQVVVVAKPKYKRNDYRRLRAIMEVPYDEAFRRAQRRQRKELLSTAEMFPQADGQLSSPYSYMAGSDSEYSAECASLFHSTIVDTSEDERSNYTTNCFGDSESSEEEYVEESTTTSDTEESGGGGAGSGWGQLGTPGARAMGQEMTQAQAKAVVKIKASHNLKKRILRFGSGSLKLMTTV